MKVNGKDYPIYYGKEQMFETTNQFSNCMGKYVTHIYIYEYYWYHINIIRY